MYPSLSLYIDGRFLSGEGRQEQEVRDPANGQLLGHLPWASDTDLIQAMLAAHRAFESWRISSPMERSAVLRKVGELARERADVIARHITLDNGKPLAEAHSEVLNSAEHAEWNAEECRRF